MFIRSETAFTDNLNATGFYVCSNCGSNLFDADKKFEAGCGFPSFSLHINNNVELRVLDTYGKHRTQLLCSNCGQHLGHLFDSKNTPSGKRYCINGNAISYRNGQ